MDFKDELQALINRYSQENGSNTPDFILAAYLTDCLQAFNAATQNRESWYGVELKPGEDAYANVPSMSESSPVID